MSITLLAHQPIDFTYKENSPNEYLSSMCLQYETGDNPQFQVKNTTGTAPLVTIQGSGDTDFEEIAIPATIYSVEGNYYTYTLNFEYLGITSGCYELCIYEISSSSGSNLATNGTFDTDLTGWTVANGITLDVDSYTGTSVTLVASGGSAPYEYSNGGSTFQSSEIFTGLAPGTTYTFYVRDSSGVTGSVIFTLRDCSAYAGSYAYDIKDIPAVEIKDCYAADFV